MTDDERNMAFWNGIHLSAACRYQVKGKLEIINVINLKAEDIYS